MPKKRATTVPIEELLANILKERVGVRPVTEYRFCPERMWRFDCAFPNQKLAVEIDGRHHIKHGQHRKDCEKRNAAKEMGWTVLVYPAGAVIAKCRQPLIADQVARVLHGVCDPDLAVSVLS